MIKEKHLNKKLSVIAGFSMNKNIEENIKVINTHAYEVYFVGCDNARASKAQDLYNKARQIAGNWNIISNGNIESTIRHVVGKGGKEDVVVICGSFYIMCEARKVLGYSDTSD